MSIQFKINSYGSISVLCLDKDGYLAVQEVIDSMKLAFSKQLNSYFFTIPYSTIQLTINKNDDSSDDDVSAQDNDSTKLKIVEALKKIGGVEVEHFNLENGRTTYTPKIKH